MSESLLLRGQCCIFKRVILSNHLPVFVGYFIAQKCAYMCVQSHFSILWLYFFLSAISPFCISNFIVHNHLRVFFVSYFIERCSFAILACLVRKKKIKLIHADISIYTRCVLLYHSPVLQNTKMIQRQNFSKDKNMRFKLVYKFSQRL